MGAESPDTESQEIGRMLCVNDGIIKNCDRDHGGEMEGQ